MSWTTNHKRGEPLCQLLFPGNAELHSVSILIFHMKTALPGKLAYPPAKLNPLEHAGTIHTGITL